MTEISENEKHVEKLRHLIAACDPGQMSPTRAALAAAIKALVRPDETDLAARLEEAKSKYDRAATFLRELEQTLNHLNNKADQ